MKLFLYILVLSLFPLCLQSQNIRLEIKTNSEKEQAIVDSLGYEKIHILKNTIPTSIQNLESRLKKLGYLNLTISEALNTNDTLAIVTAALGNPIKNVLIYKDRISTENQGSQTGLDSIIIPFSSVESYLQNYTKQLEVQGYSMAKVSLSQFRESGQTLITRLIVETGQIRQINEIVVNGYDKFPIGHQKNINRLFRNSTFTQINIERLRKEYDKFPFVLQTKYPEILLTTDTTKVYIYLEKANANRFDGIIGFSNDEESTKLIFNGYLDLQLSNALQTGETFELYWKSDGQKQTTFKSSIELPYIFKSPFALKTSLNIFKQDSTFQNTKTAFEVGYYLSYNKRFFGGYQSTESSDIQNLNSSLIKDYKNSFFTAAFEYNDYRPELSLFPYKTLFTVKTGIGQRISRLEKVPQLFFETNVEHSFYLNSKNVVWIKNTNYFLNSKEYIVGELYRFGGSRSIRGFTENALQANLAMLLSTEYRYLLSSSLYAHSVLDYGFYTDDSQIAKDQNENSIMSLGFGFGLKSKMGLFTISYSNGFLTNATIDLQTSIVHISFNTRF